MKIDGYEAQLVSLARELIGYLVKLGASPQDGEDIAQETLVKILEIDDLLPFDKIRPWFFRVGMNHYYNLYNRKKRYQEIISLHFSRGFETEFSQDYSRLYAGLKQLSPSAAQLLLLKYDQGLSIAEMSVFLERPEASLKTELYRARQKLKKILESESETHGI